MLLETIYEYKHLFVPGAQTELRMQRNTTSRVSLRNGEIVTNERTDQRGVSARVRKNGLYGFASAPQASKEAINAVLEQASNNALFLDRNVKDKGELISIPPLQTADRLTITNIMPDSPMNSYVELVRIFDDYIVKNCPQITSRTVIATSDNIEKVISVSQGTDGHVIIPRSHIYIIMTAVTDDGAPVELFKAIGGYGVLTETFARPEEFFPEIDQLYARLLDKRQGVAPQAGRKKVILGGLMSGMLAHEAVGHTVEADLVLGGSVGATNLNKQVASELVSMVDYAHTAFGKPCPLPVYLDDEGTVAQDQLLIKDGILVGFMNNRATAARFDMEPQGNARAFSFSDEPLIRMRNTAVLPGESNLEEMISSIDDGYYLLDSSNGQADTTGEFMFGVTMGYEIKNGKLGKALFDTTISGVAFEMLKTVDMISSDFVWSSAGFCGKKQMIPVSMGGPYLRCEVMIGGN